MSGARFRRPAGMLLAALATLASAFTYADEPAVPNYTELNARLGWRPTSSVEVSLSGENLLHARHVEYGFPDPSRIEIDRSVSGRIQCRF